MKLLQVERRGWAQLGGKSGLGDDDVSATHNFSLSLSLSLSLPVHHSVEISTRKQQRSMLTSFYINNIKTRALQICRDTDDDFVPVSEYR